MRNIKKWIRLTGLSWVILYKSSGLLFILYLGLNLGVVSLPIINAFIMQTLLDVLVSNMFSYVEILSIVLVILILQAVQAIMASLKNVIYNSIFQRVEYYYECGIMEYMISIPLDLIDSLEGKNLLDDIRHARNIIVYLPDKTIRIISSLYSFVISFVVLVSFNFSFSIISVLLIIPGIILDIVFEHKSEKFRHLYAADVRKFSYYRWMLTDSVTAKDVRMYDLTSPIKNKYNEEKNKYLRENKKLDLKKTMGKVATEIIRLAGDIIFTTYVLIQCFRGSITIGEVTLYTGLILTITNDFYNIVGTSAILLLRSREVTDGVNDFLGVFSKGKSCCTEKQSLNYIESITFEDVYFKYPQAQNYVLSGVSFTIQKGEHISLVGINGSGKTTIIKLLIGLYRPTSGEIRINGCSYSDYNVSDIRKQFSVLFQNYIKYPLTLRDNITFSDPYRVTTDENIEKCLFQSGIYKEFLKKMNDGLNTTMMKAFDDNGVELSGGQWQLIAIARTRYKQASVYIFDEFEASLDPQNEDAMWQELNDREKIVTSITITHKIVNTRLSDRVIVLADGKIIEDGTHEELLRKNGLYANMYIKQKDKYKI